MSEPPRANITPIDGKITGRSVATMNAR